LISKISWNIQAIAHIYANFKKCGATRTDSLKKTGATKTDCPKKKDNFTKTRGRETCTKEVKGLSLESLHGEPCTRLDLKAY